VFRSVLKRDTKTSYLQIPSVESCSEISQTHVLRYNRENESLIGKMETCHILWFVVYSIRVLSRYFLFRYAE